jgi:hypothetical protein
VPMPGTTSMHSWFLEFVELVARYVQADDPLDERVRLVELNELRALFTSRLRNPDNSDDDDET